MDAFFIGPPIGAPEPGGIVHLADDDHVQLLQAFPAYASELPMVKEIGAVAFGQRLGADIGDPRRDPVPA